MAALTRSANSFILIQNLRLKKTVVDTTEVSVVMDLTVDMNIREEYFNWAAAARTAYLFIALTGRQMKPKTVEAILSKLCNLNIKLSVTLGSEQDYNPKEPNDNIDHQTKLPFFKCGEKGDLASKFDV